VWLAVVGQSRQRADMQILAQRLGVVHRVWFLGSLADMDDAYQAADCLVHPTLEDTYAMVVLEAMAHGLPVVVSGAQWCGIAAELQHRVHALVLQDPASASDLQTTITAILSDQQLVETLSSNAVEFARHRTWRDVAQKHEALYLQVKN
jgi:UDP-glucose:(heptosyl)LPS alpha-1,3-glucosyltransferase